MYDSIHGASELFSGAPNLNESFQKALSATAPLDVAGPEQDVAMMPISSGSHAPVKDQQGVPISGRILG